MEDQAKVDKFWDDHPLLVNGWSTTDGGLPGKEFWKHPELPVGMILSKEAALEKNKKMIKEKRVDEIRGMINRLEALQKGLEENYNETGESYSEKKKRRASLEKQARYLRESYSYLFESTLPHVGDVMTDLERKTKEVEDKISSTYNEEMSLFHTKDEISKQLTDIGGAILNLKKVEEE